MNNLTIYRTRPLAHTIAAPNEGDAPFRQATQRSCEKVVTNSAQRISTIPKSQLPVIFILETPFRTLFVSHRHPRLAFTVPIIGNATALGHFQYREDYLRLYSLLPAIKS